MPVIFKHVVILLTLVGSLIGSAKAAEQAANIHLKCKSPERVDNVMLEITVDPKVGDEFIWIELTDKEQGVLHSTEEVAVFSATISAEWIRATGEYSGEGGYKRIRKIKINRFTGSIESLVTDTRGSDTIHKGTCEKLDKPLF